MLDRKEGLVARVQAEPSRGTGAGQFISPHGLTPDSRGNLYVGEVDYTSWSRSFPDVRQPERIDCLQKLAHVVDSAYLRSASHQVHNIHQPAISSAVRRFP